MLIINLERHIAMRFSRFLPSDLREQRSNIGLHGIAAHSMLVSHFLVSVAVTKHYCLTVVSRCGALCCPDFPRRRGYKPSVCLPLLRDEPVCYISIYPSENSPYRAVFERHKGVEPSSSAWEADALPMC